jgi:hypothetical protein
MPAGRPKEMGAGLPWFRIASAKAASASFCRSFGPFCDRDLTSALSSTLLVETIEVVIGSRPRPGRVRTPRA